MRTEKEKADMIKDLSDMKNRLPEFNVFGNANWEDIDAQIAVIAEEKDEDEIYDEYPTEEEQEEFMERISSCILVSQWLQGQDNESEILDL